MTNKDNLIILCFLGLCLMSFTKLESSSTIVNCKDGWGDFIFSIEVVENGEVIRFADFSFDFKKSDDGLYRFSNKLFAYSEGSSLLNTPIKIQGSVYNANQHQLDLGIQIYDTASGVSLYSQEILLGVEHKAEDVLSINLLNSNKLVRINSQYSLRLVGFNKARK